ncbi:hypothetical protein [Falsibacillus albus]|uniref:Uncharacterized protein n=1 Tax=Falsibacillus albus TaxID=2478915 RepID=A0A3L7JS63_9BACI|nr:hypothetical protein [Falsibacillus albus]RLQ93663.1 hypothetical protein D9X91_16915 [Falsibacillus albus]
MAEIAHVVALNHFLMVASAVILFILITYLFMRRAAAPQEMEFTLKKGVRKFIFNFLHSAMAGFLFYLVNNEKTGAMMFFVLFLIVLLLLPEKTYESKSIKAKIISSVFLLVLVILTSLWTASISVKGIAWLIIFMAYLLEKIEKKVFILDNNSSHGL